MASPVTAKLTQLSNQYSNKVADIRKYKAEKRNGGAGVSDAEAKRLNGLIDALDKERLEIADELNKLKKLEKPAKDVDEYSDLNKKLAQYEAQIAKRIARGEGTADLDKIKQETLGKLEKIAPAVEQNFPELKKAEPKSTKTGPLGNVQMTTGTTVAGTAASKAAAAKKKVVTPAVDEQLKPPPKPGKTPSTTAFAQEDVVDTTTLEGIKKASARTVTGTKTATGDEDINAIYALARSKYDNVDSIFLYDPELKQILIDAVGDIATAKDDMDAARVCSSSCCI
jgi:chromosome segregation ATPase